MRQDTRYGPKNQLIPGPECWTMRAAWQGGSAACTNQTDEDWLKDIQHWRFERRIRTGLDQSSWRYDEPALRWAQTSFIQPQMMVHDRYSYDSVAHRYTVDRYLDDLQSRYGGIDAVLIWATLSESGH